MPHTQFSGAVQALPSEEDKPREAYSDGSSKKPRPNQIRAVDWLRLNGTEQVRVLTAPTGAGKSWIAKNQAMEQGSVIVVPDNIQMAQYVRVYPELNYLKGKNHYESEADFFDAKRRLWQGEPTVVNIHSWVFWTKFGGFSAKEEWGKRFPTKILIVDEFHNLHKTLIGMESGKFTRRSHHGLPITEQVTVLVNFFKGELSKVRDSLSGMDRDDTLYEETIFKKYQLSAIITGLADNADEYVIDPDSRYKSVTVTRFEPSDDIVAPFKMCPVIAMSATPRPQDIKLLGKKVARLDLPSEIPVKHRQIYRVPVPFKMNWQTKLEDIKPYIDKILLKHKGQNGVIHCTYARQAQFEALYPDFIYHTSGKSKDRALGWFKEEGGILVASGCSEGIDLPGDLCRFQIIPWMVKPNIGDLWVKHRMAKRDGRQWYSWEVLTTFAQMAGRSSRSKEDMSTVYTFDPYIVKIFNDYHKEMWSWFKAALVLYRQPNS
tara:strand:+ start:10382 stop:11848 length:1467 start_codon:yes stop_codon:yes gene_type:complete